MPRFLIALALTGSYACHPIPVRAPTPSTPPPQVDAAPTHAEANVPEVDVPPFVGCERPTGRTCERDVVPVCAATRDDTRRQFPSACLACDDPQVVGYWPVPCSELPLLRPPDAVVVVPGSPRPSQAP